MVIEEVPSVQLVADNQQLSIESVGNVEIGIDRYGKEHTVLLTNVLHVPDVSTNLFPMNKITKRGHTVIFDKYKRTILNQDKNIVAIAVENNGMYGILDRCKNRINAVMTLNYETWQHRLEHPSHDTLMKISAKLVKSIKIDTNSRNVYISYIKGKQHPI